MMRIFKIAAAALLVGSASWLSACAMNEDMSGDMASASANGVVTVGGAPMYANRDIVANAVNSADHTTLVAAVKAAGLVGTLQSAGPFTVFAPTNAAFGMLPAGTVDTLLMPTNLAMLQSVLKYHVVPGRFTAASLAQRIRAGGGSARLATASGGTLTAKMRGDDIVIVDGKGGVATVTQADVRQSNGVIHVTNRVSLAA